MALSKLGKEIIKDIESTVTELRAKEFLRDENGLKQQIVSGNVLELTYNGKNESSSIVFDKHISCSQIMDELLAARQYNLIFYDKSLIQAEFIIDGDEIIKERLVFMKKHNNIWERSEIDELDALDVDWFSEETGVPIMIRIDYAPIDHEECEHACVHLTISNHKSCRVPIKNIISFSEFVNFILLHFYDKHLEKTCLRFRRKETITEAEKKMLHISWN